jgi:hypothetical protein
VVTSRHAVQWWPWQLSVPWRPASAGARLQQTARPAMHLRHVAVQHHGRRVVVANRLLASLLALSVESGAASAALTAHSCLC